MSERWIEVTASQFPWEKAALHYLREHFPNHEPFRAWANFEFIAEDGSINEVDLLVLALQRLYLVEIKSRPGRLTGDAGTWTWTHDGRSRTDDNPLLLANRKAKKLKTLLQHQKALSRGRVPYIEALIFLSATGLHCDLTGPARHGVYGPQEPTHQHGLPSILQVLFQAQAPGSGPPAPRLEHALVQATARAIEQAGIRPSQRSRRVGDYVLQRLLGENDLYQDWEATHSHVPKIMRRIRLYPQALHATALSRTERRQAAEREFRLLEGLQHPGILRIEGFTEHERGPALIVEHEPEAVRLDVFLQQRGAQLDSTARLGLLRQVAETLHYAHAHRLYHRALSPQTILVLSPTQPTPQLKIFDWQTAWREQSPASTTQHAITHSLHLELFSDQQTLLYMAPEALAGLAFDAAKLDVFALGALGYHLCANRAPATSLEALQHKCATGQGLRISEVLDGAGDRLQELIQRSTCPAVEERLDMQEFLDLLSEVEEECRTPAPETFVPPLEARAQDRLQGGFGVLKRLGKGSTSIALLVERDGQEGVLKIALDPAQNARLVEEGQILRTLRHQNIVELYEQCEVSGHAALFMARAGSDLKSGAYTLAQRLRSEGRLSLDLLQRFGEELLLVTEWLEQHGIAHRDIKPDNIGIGKAPSGKLTVLLFDFSLATTPFEQLRAGTPPYLDPFVRRRKRWDWHAERFAVAMTLHEMATGTLPGWGDGQSDPALLDCEVSLDSALFDPAVREALVGFFSKALHSDVRQRFDTTEDMRRTWQRLFATVDEPVTDHGAGVEVTQVLATATRDTPLVRLGLSPRLLDALARVGAQTIDEVLHLPRIRLYRNQGLGQKIIKDIRALAERLAIQFPDAATASRQEESEPEMAGDAPRTFSVDRLLRLLLPRRLDGEEQHLLQALLGLLDVSIDVWQPQAALAATLAVPRALLQQTLKRARERWGKQAWMTALRDDVARVLEQHGGVMTPAELRSAVLTLRGSAATEPLRTRAAAALLYATLTTEGSRVGARYAVHRGQYGVFIVATPTLAASYSAPAAARGQFAERLGARADLLAAADPLLTPARLAEELQTIPQPRGEPALSLDRLLRLAVAASRTAALSSRLEIYPRHMAAARAIKLGSGALLGPKMLSVAEIQQRIASRYPLAEPVPERPLLDELLQQAGLTLVWDGSATASPGVYRPAALSTEASSGTTALQRRSTAVPASPAPGLEAALDLEARLVRAVQERRFLVLTVAPRYLLQAEAELLRRFALQRLSLETLVLQAMQETALAAGARWEVVRQADAAAPQSADWQRLRLLVRRAMPRLEQSLLRAPGPLLLVYPGLLARYDQLGLFDTLRTACTRQREAPGFLLLLAVEAQHTLPVLDQKPVPVLLASEWARIPESWLANAHRAADLPTRTPEPGGVYAHD